MANDRPEQPDPLTAWLQPWSWWGLAPRDLNQPINPGWTFGNLVVNNGNSSAPQVEQAVVSRHSYGRQIGRMMDALQAVTAALPQVAQDPRVRQFEALAHEVREIKQASAEQRLQRLQQELQALRDEHPEAWRKLAALFR
ncbi:MAG: hypothetical protein AB1430_20760 [Pseudomonadota bacterium]